MMKPIVTIFVCWCLLVLHQIPSAAGQEYRAGEEIKGSFENLAQPFLESYCIDCHSGADPEANFSVEDIGPIDEANAATWQAIWAQVALQEMPPEEADQPEVAQRLQLTDWITQNLDATMRDQGGFRVHLDPQKGNFLEHDLLFGPLPEGVELKPTSSPARLMAD